jgi:hypothetical protein
MGEPHEFPPNPGQIKKYAAECKKIKRYAMLEKMERQYLQEKLGYSECLFT